MTTLDAFYPYILPEVIGCPEPTVDLALSSTIIDFCEKTLILQVDHDPITTIPNIMDYDLEPPTGYVVVKIMSAWYKGQKLTPQGIDEINTPSVFNQRSGYVVNRGDPAYILQKDARTFSVYPIPKERAVSSLTLRVALKPTRSATSIDDIIYEEYAETIGHGAVARLAASADKPWSNPALAGVHLARYNAGVNVARDRAQKGYVRTSKHVKMRRI